MSILYSALPVLLILWVYDRIYFDLLYASFLSLSDPAPTNLLSPNLSSFFFFFLLFLICFSF